jgi:tetratricopeptide (TPR) repeat protein
VRALLAALSLCFVAHAQEDEGVPPMILRQMKMGRFSIPLEYAERELLNHPDDLNMIGLKGTVLSFLGHYAEAMPLLEQAEGTRFYEEIAIRHHADVIRATGDGLAAAALREGRLLNATLTDNHDYQDLLDVIEDYRQAGAHEQAVATAEQVLALFPDRPLTYATIARLQLDAGEVDEAIFTLWLGRWTDDSLDQRLVVVEAELLRSQGSPHAAVDLMLPLRRKLMRNVEFWVLLAHCQMDVGDLDFANNILMTMKRFADNEKPILQAARARQLVLRGDRDAATALLLDALAEMPGNPELRAAADELNIH